MSSFQSSSTGANPVSDDFSAFGLDEIYLGLSFSPARRFMAERLPGTLPTPSDFSVVDPTHVATLALLGVFLLPPDKGAASRMVSDAGSFTALVSVRVQEIRERFETHSPLLTAMGLKVTSAPEVRKSKQGTDEPIGIPRSLLPRGLAEVLDQYDREAAYLKMKREGRMNRLAAEFRHGDIGKLLRFVNEVSEVLIAWGFADYKTLSMPDRFIDHLLSTSDGSESLNKAREDLRAHRAVLRWRTPSEIWLFVRSRAGMLSEISFAAEGDTLTVICNDGTTVHCERLIDRHVDGAEVIAAATAIQS